MSQTSNEILLSHDRYHALVSPYGASLRQLWIETPERRDLIWGYNGTANKKGGQGDVLIPFPGRIAGGVYEFEGTRHTLEKNDKEGPNAIHGFVRAREWAAQATQHKAIFSTTIDAGEFASKGYPFSLSIQVSYELSASGFQCHCSITNTGRNAAPVGAGFHPYFTAGIATSESVNDWLAEIPARSVLEFNDKLLPTGKVLRVDGTALDFRKERPVGSLKLNHCFTDLERDRGGRANLSLKDPRSGKGIQLWMDQAFGYLVAYTGDALGPDARKSLALEPMSCATDAFNRHDWGLVTLAPDTTFKGAWGVAAL